MKYMKTNELNEILKKHKMWLNDEDGGVRADLHNANLRYADLCDANLHNANLCNADLCDANLHNANLRYADLCDANLRYANLCNADLCDANLSGANLCDADLHNADLRNANLRYADLSGADFDFSCLPLWCGSLSANFDSKQLKQIAYHLVKAGLQSKNASDETKAELTKLIDFANGFHRVEECGKIESEVQ